MLTHRVKFDVFDKNDLARIGAIDRLVDDRIEILSIAVGQELEGLGRARRCLEQAFALRILADGLEQLQKRLLHALELGRAATRNAANPSLRGFQLCFVVAQNRATLQSSQLNGYFSSSIATAASVNSSVCWVSNMTASSSVRVAFLLAMIVPGCGPCGIPRGCNVIEAGSIPRRDPKYPQSWLE